MSSEAITNVLPLRGTGSRRKLKEINGVSSSFDDCGCMEKSGVQIFASKPGFPGFITPK